MKALSVIVKLLVVITLLLVLAGVVLFSMGSKLYKYQASTKVEAYSLDVYPLLHSPPLMQQWMSHVTEVQPVFESGEPRNDSEGKLPNAGLDDADSLQRITYDRDGTEFQLLMKVHQASQGNYIEYHFHNEMVTGTLRYELVSVRNEQEPTEPRTEVVAKMNVQYEGPYRILAPLLSSSTQAELEEELQALKKLAEDGETLENYKSEPKRYPVPLPGEDLPEVEEEEDIPMPGRSGGG